jgi:uncharacterized protein (TIGR03083 family)
VNSSTNELQTGLVRELVDFGTLLLGVTEDQWHCQSRCVGWSVADLGRHVVGSIVDVLGGRTEGFSSLETSNRQIGDRCNQSKRALVAECSVARDGIDSFLAGFDEEAWNHPIPGLGTVAHGIRALWYDTWKHGDDIRSAIGLQPALGPGLMAAVHHVAAQLDHRGWVGNVPTKSDEAAFEWVMVATGRLSQSAVLNPPPVIVDPSELQIPVAESRSK